MHQPLKTWSINSPLFERLGWQLNAFMITQYQLSFPQREFTIRRWIISDITKAKTAYYPMIRRLCFLLNIRCLRDEYNGQFYLVGRKRSIQMAAEVLEAMVGATETHVFTNVDVWDKIKGAHKATRKSRMRKAIIIEFNSILETIINLKITEYYDKYAAMRHVKSSEGGDTIFFAEYIRENRLSHLKPLSSWYLTNCHSSKKD